MLVATEATEEGEGGREGGDGLRRARPCGEQRGEGGIVIVELFLLQPRPLQRARGESGREPPEVARGLQLTDGGHEVAGLLVVAALLMKRGRFCQEAGLLERGGGACRRVQPFQKDAGGIARSAGPFQHAGSHGPVAE